MATLVIRNVEDSLHAELKARAAVHGRSMEEEVRDVLRNAVAQDAATAAGAATPLGKHAQEIYQAFDAAGNGGVDFSGIIRHVRSLARK